MDINIAGLSWVSKDCLYSEMRDLAIRWVLNSAIIITPTIRFILGITDHQKCIWGSRFINIALLEPSKNQSAYAFNAKRFIRQWPHLERFKLSQNEHYHETRRVTSMAPLALCCDKTCYMLSVLPRTSKNLRASHGPFYWFDFLHF